MRRVLCVISALVLASCGSHVATTAPSVTPIHAVEGSASPTASTAGGNQDAVLGPAGMTLQQEIGAVMMVGFKGPLIPAVLHDWRQHQFGGLLVVPGQQTSADSGSGTGGRVGFATLPEALVTVSAGPVAIGDWNDVRTAPVRALVILIDDVTSGL